MTDMYVVIDGKKYPDQGYGYVYQEGLTRKVTQVMTEKVSYV